MKSFTRLALIASVALLTACQSTPRTVEYTVRAKVHKIFTADDVCHYQKKKNKTRHEINLFGALLGGAAGYQFGGGSGKKWAAAGGALLGGYAMGNKKQQIDPNAKLICKRNGYIASVSYLHPVSGVMISTGVPLNHRTRNEYIRIPVYVTEIPTSTP